MISTNAPRSSMVLSISCHETRRKGLTTPVMLASVVRRTPTSYQRQHSPRVYRSRSPSELRFASTSSRHGSPLPSHTVVLEARTSVWFSSDSFPKYEAFSHESRRLRPVFSMASPTTSCVETDPDVNTFMQYVCAWFSSMHGADRRVL